MRFCESCTNTWLAWLKPGYSFKVAIDEVGKSYPAKVLRIGSPDLGTAGKSSPGASTLAIVQANQWLEEEFAALAAPDLRSGRYRMVLAATPTRPLTQ